MRARFELCSTQGADGRAGGMVHSSAEALKAAIVGYEPLGLGTPGDCKCTPSQHTTDTHHHNTPQHNRRQHRTPHHTTPTTPHTPHHTTLHFCWNRLSLLPLTASQSRRCCCDLRMEIEGALEEIIRIRRENVAAFNVLALLNFTRMCMHTALCAMMSHIT